MLKYLYFFSNIRKDNPIEADDYLTIADSLSVDVKIKGSQFIGTIAPSEKRKKAEAFIQNIRQTYHDASHNCFAYRISETDFRFSDDGEPAGTAGRPILSMLDKYQLNRTVLIVTRYFGGTKLGTGGLIRAYSGSAEKTILQAKIIKKHNYRTVNVEYPFDYINKVQHLVHQFDGQIQEDATNSGMASRIHVFPSRTELFKEKLVEIGAGKIIIKDKPYQ